jgi:3beta-hydroxy-delta5-steroid dehydrogenase/steroid delta-isomerase
MSTAAQATGDLGFCLVTGGAGYLGRHLVAELLRRGHLVRCFDRTSGSFAHDRLETVIGDITDYGAVRKACEGVETVFHTAAVLDFRRFPGRAGWGRSRAVNVGGVENLIRACVEAGVRRLVHTSTNNVTLQNPVVDGDETWPYARRPKDPYTATKIEGEMLALDANGEGRLLTCAIRPGGIYGPGETLMLRRVVAECAGGRFIVTIGDGSALSDNTYIENLVDGHIEAARHLVPGSPLGGQAYYVTDGEPVNYFDFFRPFVEALGYRFPTFKLPAAPLRPVLWCWELLGRWIPLPAPPLTVLELDKMVVSHYNRNDKARRDFGWTPKVSPEDAVLRCLPYLIKLNASLARAGRTAPVLSKLRRWRRQPPAAVPAEARLEQMPFARALIGALRIPGRRTGIRDVPGTSSS